MGRMKGEEYRTRRDPELREGSRRMCGGESSTNRTN